MLQNNAGNDLTVAANGNFTFSSAISSGTTYVATVFTQPTTQTCTVSSGSGTAIANVTNIAITCVTNTYTIGGTVSGLNGTVVLQNNTGNDLTVSTNGSFTFSSPIISGATYAATILTQPTTQTCTVSNGSGTAIANVTNIAITCVTNTYTIGGTVSGLNGTVVLQNNTGNDLTVSTNGSFTFSSAINSGTTYAATLLTQPATQTCTVSSGSGTATSNVTNIVVTCTDTVPTLSLTIQQTKTFHFSWIAVTGATSYKLKEDPTGSAGYAQVGTDLVSNVTSYDDVVPLYLRVNARYILSAFVSGTWVDSNIVNVSGTLTAAVGYFKASNTGANDQFGHSIALSANGSTLAIGALNESSNATGIGGDQTNNNALKAGAVYVFILTGTTWSQQAYVKASNTATNDYFGASVALSADGNTLTVGADGEASNAIGIGGDQTDTSMPNAGAVYVFTRTGSSWSQQAYVKASNTDAGDYFGASVALSTDGNTMTVGAYGEASNAIGIDNDDTNNSAANAGAVYVFTRTGSTWSQQAYVKAFNTDADDYFGASVALSSDGNTMTVGAYGEASNAIGIDNDHTNNSVANAGAAYVFTRAGSTWSQQAYVKASNTGAGDQFGYSVALSTDGNTLAVGAFLESSNAIGINGNQTNNTAPEAGAVYMFTRTGITWSQQAYVKASNTDAGDHFGYPVSLSADGNTLAVGASAEDSNATGVNGNQTDNSLSNPGALYVFTRTGTTWSQQAYVKASNTVAGDFFGDYSVALSADGNTLAVAACLESSNATGINGNQADNSLGGTGAVYLY